MVKSIKMQSYNCEFCGNVILKEMYVNEPDIFILQTVIYLYISC